jgi:chromosome segregation protein
MDKGAHFFRCDFQVHTPRDVGWKGGGAVTDAERKAYADELILACRKKDLRAIAITDHHDFAFFPYVKKAAEDELDDSGNPVPEGRRIVVFPGIEITLTSPNCQAILILDADFPENLFESVLTTLAITPAPSSDSNAAEVQRISQDVVPGLPGLYEKLNALKHLKGRFIVLPNVTETGYGTLLRSGFGNFYRTMPCVGGFTGGPVSKFGKGALEIVTGKDRNYGFKSIGIFQTSDNRKRDHTDLGKHTTWVKWSEPTAEALRQACLAKESRLSQIEPELPTSWITALTVSNSKFLGRVNLDFNQQYNAIIGGRGSGKSTILEYLRWGLCDQPVETTDSEMAPVQMNRKKLISNTLLKVEGEVHVTFLLNDVEHIVKRNSKTQEVFLKVGDGDFAPTNEQEVRNLLPIQAYSQKQLSSVGVRLDELRRFVELPVKQSLDQIRSDIQDIEAKIRVAYVELIRKKEVETEISKYNLEIDSLTKQVAALRKTLKGLSDADQEIIKQKALFENEELIIEDLKNELARAAELLAPLEVEFNEAIAIDDGGELQNPALIKKIREQFSLKFKEINKQIAVLSGLFEESSLKQLNEAIEAWEKAKEAFEKKYEAAKARAKVNQQQLKQIQDVEKRAAELKKIQMLNRNTLSSLGDPGKTYEELRKKWNDSYTEKINVLDKQCKNFSSLSNGLIKADIKGSLDVESLKRNCKIAFAGSNIKEQKIENLCECVLAAADPIAAWNGILADLEKLAFHNVEGTDALPACPTIDKCDFKTTEKTRIAAGVGYEKWLDLSLAELEFNPVFQYCTNKSRSEYIAFVDASAGQQATALFTALLNQEGASLIIDQPEDDVDSKVVKGIIERIWTAKSKRQLIFASHNANFVVNGDAELVICCDYVKAGDQTAGTITLTGAIDNQKIRDEITSVTEGGEEAFKLRKEKYGF